MEEFGEKSDAKKGSEFKNYGFDLYYERRPQKEKLLSFSKYIGSDKINKRHQNTCEKNVLSAMRNHPMIKVLVGALEKAGCPINVRRHIVCENCSSAVAGGYDQELNQIVICHNNFKIRHFPEVALIHELIHMYDYCVGEVNYKNLEHLACSEIRAANLCHCSFMSSMLLGQSSPINIKKSHQYCVKIKATESIMLARNLDFNTAFSTILKVFTKCYNDLEPIGRRVRKNSLDPMLAYDEALHMGFC